MIPCCMNPYHNLCQKENLPFFQVAAFPEGQKIKNARMYCHSDIFAPVDSINCPLRVGEFLREPAAIAQGFPVVGSNREPGFAAQAQHLPAE